MRVRKKKHLDERLEKVSNLLINTDISDRNYITSNKQKEYIDLKSIFENDNPLYLEIGCGKGRFCIEYAKRHPEINLLAVEVEPNVIVSAVEAASRENLKNLYFLRTSAEFLPKFLKAESVQRIFLNFSCPYPKNRYATHRLTSPRFLEIYKELLCENGEIHQKTDNMHFFEFSIENLSKAGFKLQNVSLDLHNSGFEGNIVTEYEERFINEGLPIYRLEAVNK